MPLSCEKPLQNEISENNPTSIARSLFDNSLTQKILTKQDVALIFRKSESWVSRMMSCGTLPHHYVGDTAMFYSEEILKAFLNDSLANPRRNYDQKENKRERISKVRSSCQTQGPSTLSEIRQLQGR